MSRPYPRLPHPNGALVTSDGKIATEWHGQLLELVRRVPVNGTATFAAATTVAVTLAAPEADTTYKILVEGVSARTYWPSAKTVTGFTLNASASNSDAVTWFLLRT